MKTMARCYLREALTSYGTDRAKVLYEGMRHFTDGFMEVVNDAHPSDLPMVLAALDTAEDVIKELPEYKAMRHAEAAIKLCRKLTPVMTRQRVEIRLGEDDGREHKEIMYGF